jgi:fructose-bisphosphate aldolase, class II
LYIKCICTVDKKCPNIYNSLVWYFEKYFKPERIKMALINMKDLLAHAKENKYAVGAFNVTNIDLIDHILDAAVESNSPVILQLAEMHFRYLNLEDIAPALISAARNVSIPVCVHLDHGKSLKTMVRAIRAGFTSIMYDGSEHPLEENARNTREVVRIAHSVDVSVEGELGNVGGEAVGVEAAVAHSASEDLFTRVEDARYFVNETGLDTLAISIGNVHGLYEGEPRLDFDRLKAIKDTVDIPLVLHGGSGISDDDFRKAAGMGICKINFYTGISQAAVQRVHKFIEEHPGSISYPDLAKMAMDEVKKVVMDRMAAFGSRGQCAADKTLCITCSETSCGITDPRFKPEAKTVIYQDLVERISSEVLQNIKK